MNERVLEGRVAVVTGASRGIGRYAAELFASHGAAVALCARSGADLLDVAGTIEKAHGVEVYAAAADVTDHSAVAEFASGTAKALGAPDVVLNNAGTLGPVGPLDGADLGEWERALRVNVVGTVNVTAVFLPAMASRGSGSIVNLSGGGTGGPGVPARLSAYTTSKAAIVGFTETLAKELAPQGVRVNAVAPGAVATGFNDPILAAGPEGAGRDLYEGTLRQRESPDSLERFGDLLLYLASDASSWLTGKLLSARWDTVERIEAARPQLEGSSLFTLRRIDDALFAEVTRDSAEPDGES